MFVVGRFQTLPRFDVVVRQIHHNRALDVKIHRVVVQTCYFEWIRQGIKTVEARVHKNPYSEIQNGDLIAFQAYEGLHPLFYCRVKKKVVYPTFYELLTREGVKQCLPGVESVEQGVVIYHSFSKYASDVKKYQAVAFRLSAITKEEINDE